LPAACDTASSVSRVDSPAASAAASEKKKEAGNAAADVHIYLRAFILVSICVLPDYYVAGRECFCRGGAEVVCLVKALPLSVAAIDN
jgi:biotin synthase-related radical SAM superfamily protein